MLAFCIGEDEVALPTPLAIDNNGALSISQDPAMKSGLKHVQRRHFFLRNMVESFELERLESKKSAPVQICVSWRHAVLSFKSVSWCSSIPRQTSLRQDTNSP